MDAVRPFVLIRTQHHPRAVCGFSLERLLELLRECFSDPRGLFRNAYPDLYTEFTFPGLQTLFSRDFLVFVCDLLQFSSIRLGGGLRGLFEICSLFNHSCHPNCSYAFSDGKVQVHLRPGAEFKETDELYLCYVDEDAGYEERRRQLHDQYGFWCSCQRCLHQQ